MRSRHFESASRLLPRPGIVGIRNNRVQKFDSTGSFITKSRSYGSGNGQFRCACRLAINQATGQVYVAEAENSRVQVFDSNGASKVRTEAP